MKDRSSKLTSTIESLEWQDEEPREGARWRFLLVPAVVIVFVAAMVWLLQAGQEDTVGATTQITFGGKATGAAPKPGAPAPDFTLTTLDGKKASLGDFRGKVVLLNFFATWCPPCRAEMPDLEATYKELKGKGLEIVAIDLQEDNATVSGFTKSLGLTFPILLDRGADVFGQYHITGLPTTFFIDRDGVIREFVIGGLNKKIIMEKLGKIL